MAAPIPGEGASDPGARQPGNDWSDGVPAPGHECRIGQTLPRGPAIWRLTHVQYSNALVDLFGELGRVPEVSAQLPLDPREKEVFAFALDGLAVSEGLGRYYRVAAEHIGTRLAAEPMRALALAGCDAPSRSCGASLVTGLGRRVFRRPPTAAQVARYQGLFEASFDEASRAGGGAAQALATGVRAVVEAMLQSPAFLYRVERGQPLVPDAADDRLRLDGFEVATRLSFALWAAPPDEGLLDAAAAGELDTLDGVRTQAERLLADPRALRAVNAFHDELLGNDQLQNLTRDTSKYREFAAVTADDLRGEVEAFVRHQFTQDGSLHDLLTAPYTFANARIARLYGVRSPPNSAQEFVRVDLPADQRAGLLTQTGLLTRHAHFDITAPILRGAFVLHHFLCVDFPPPPAGATDQDPDFGPGVSVRQAFGRLTAGAACRGCHQGINNAGFAFEHFGPTGEWQEADRGGPVDASGELDILATPITFRNAVEFIHGLAAAPEVHACYARHWSQFLLGLRPDQVDDCQVRALAEAHARGEPLRATIAQAIATPALLMRRPAEVEEVLP